MFCYCRPHSGVGLNVLAALQASKNIAALPTGGVCSFQGFFYNNRREDGGANMNSDIAELERPNSNDSSDEDGVPKSSPRELLESFCQHQVGEWEINGPDAKGQYRAVRVKQIRGEI